jgi:tetratricopeptide (TPR) repeat protein
LGAWKSKEHESMSKPGRNDPCPCGSGKKYKKCCLPRDEAARSQEAAARPRAGAQAGEKPYIAELRPDLDDKVDCLLQRLESGEGRAVEADLQALLAEHPRYHATHYAMGVYTAVVAKDPLHAIPYFERAVQILPPFAEAHYNLGSAAMKAGDAAMECFERALALDPKYEPAMANRRIVARMREGEPFIPDGMQETYYYAEKIQKEKESGPL